MIIADVVQRLYATLPLLTDVFSDQLSISSATNVTDTATIVTSTPHGLSTGHYVLVKDPLALNPITAFNVTNEIAAVETGADHDLTFGFHTSVVLSGLEDPLVSGTFQLRSVPNRRSFTISVPGIPDGAYVTGSEMLQESRHSIEGWRQVTVLDSTSFTIPSDFNYTFDYYAPTMSIHKNTRVAGAATFERALEAYNRMASGKIWAFGVLGKTTASRQYKSATNAVAINSGASDFRQDLLQDFSVFLFTPASGSPLGRAERDNSSLYASYVMRCLAGHPLPTAFQDKNILVPNILGHDFRLYDGSVYVHEITFEVPEALSRTDLVDITVTRAFRDIIISSENDYNIDVVTSSLDLDDMPV